MVTTRPNDPAKYSVQGRAEDYNWLASPDVTGNIFVQIGNLADEVPEWNALFPNRRDRYLKQFMRSDTMLTSAIYSMKTRLQTLNYTVNGSPRAKKYALELLQNPGFQDNLIDIAGKWTDDLLTADNGAFIELWRPGSPLRDAKSAPVVGFASLDSRQCWRSFDEEFPVWYTNPQTGEIRKIHRSRVLMMSDNPQPIELARNIGFCAVSRAWRWAHLMRSIMIYRDEKVTGRFTRAIGAIKGVNAKQVKDALRAIDDESDSKGFVVYKGIPFLVNPGTDAAADVDILLQDLASLGDGFEFRTDIDLYAYVLALSLGVDAREFWPATTSGATKADASIQNMKARGRGLGFLIQSFESVIRRCLPDTVEFTFDYTDDEQDEMQARIHSIRLGNLKTLHDAQAINGLEMRALAIAEGIIDGMLLEELNIPADTDTALDGNQPQEQALEENSENPADPQDAPQDTEQETRQKSILTYRDTLAFYVRALWEGSYGYFDFLVAYQNAIRNGFTEAWNAGAALCGMTPDDRTEAEQTRLNLEIYTEYTYVTKFAQDIIAVSKANGGSLESLYPRVNMWANAYGRVLTIAQTMACADKKGRWIRGYTEEGCFDCKGYDTRVYRMSVWNKFLTPYDALPKGRGLFCKGFNCQCVIDPTDAPVTKGFPPRPVGGFKEHGNHRHNGTPTSETHQREAVIESA